MISRYETLLLAVPEITTEEVAMLEQHVEQTVKNNGGSMISYERWGKYRLAYQVQKNDYGVYILARFETEQNKKQLMDQLKNLFTLKFPQLIMRYVITAMDPKAPLTYLKPESLEDIPTHDVDTFLRDNKMEGLKATLSSDRDMSGDKLSQYED